MKTAISGFLFVLLSSMLAAAQSYTVYRDLGVLKSDNESSGFWINDSGTVVGCSDTETSEGYPCTGTVAGQHAFMWTKIRRHERPGHALGRDDQRRHWH